MSTFWDIASGKSPNWPSSKILWETPQCAYVKHLALATRMAVLADDRKANGVNWQPVCRNHRASELHGFIRWEPLRVRNP